MKVLIGITQDPEQGATTMNKDFNGRTISSEVGPFASATDASKWMEFISSRADDFEVKELPAGSVTDTPWYGITVEETVS